MALVAHLSSPVSHNSNVNVLLSVDTIHICLVWCSYVSVACCLWSRWLRLPSHRGYALITVWPPTPRTAVQLQVRFIFLFSDFHRRIFSIAEKNPPKKTSCTRDSNSRLLVWEARVLVPEPPRLFPHNVLNFLDCLEVVCLHKSPLDSRFDQVCSGLIR